MSDAVVRADSAVRKRRRKKSFFAKLWEYKILLLMCLPAVGLIFVFSYIPMPGLYIAFVDFKYALGIFGSPFVGFRHFEFLISSGRLFELTRNTVLYNIAFILLGNVMQLIVALLLNEIRSKYFRKITQTLMLLPHFISYVLVGLFAYAFLNYEYGLINGVRVGMGMDRFSFYGEASLNYWPFIIVFVNLWKGVGYGTIVYFAAIMGIDAEMLEAAHIDGANSFQRIWYILLPNLRATFTILILLALGGILKGNFQLFFNLVSNNSILLPRTDIIETYVWRAMMTNFNFPQGSAVSLFQSVFGFIIVLFFNWVVKRVEPDHALF